MHRILSISLLLQILLSSFLAAQQPEEASDPPEGLTQTLRGTVVDADSKASLEGATIYVVKADKPITGAYSNEKGQFKIEKVPLGRYNIAIRYIGYEEMQIPNLLVNSGKEVILNIELKEEVVSMDKVEIIAQQRTQAKNEMATVSTRPFSIEESMRYAGSWNDPARMAMNFAGVSGANDERNDIIIRGNSPAGVLWRLDGIDIPNPNHFGTFGTTGGPVSMLNNNVLDNSDFMTGAFPAEYGNALAGVFDLQMRKGNNEQREFLAQVGLNGLEFLAEGPFSKKHNASYLASYRYSTLELFKLMGLKFGTSAIPQYQDLSFKINIPTEKAGNFSLFGLGGLSSVAVLDSERDEGDFFGPAGTDIYNNVKSGAIGASHLWLVSGDAYLKTTLSVQGSQNEATVDSIPKATRIPTEFYENFTQQDKVSLAMVFNKKFSARHTLRTGFFADKHHFDILERLKPPVLGRWYDLTRFDGSTYQIRPYIQWKYRITDKLSINPGVHYHHFFLNNTNAIEPRVGVQWNFLPGKTLAAAYGKHSQLQPVYVYFKQTELSPDVYDEPNRDIGFTKSDHYVLSYTQQLGKSFNLRAETYYQNVYNAPVNGNRETSFSMLNLGADFVFIFPDTLANTGTGRNYGLELTLEKYFSKNYYFLLTGSIFDSKYTGSDGVLRNTAFNGNYAVNLLAGVELTLGKKKNLVFGANGRTTVAGGKRYTPIDPEASEVAREAVFVREEAWSQQFQPYFRTDLRLSLRQNFKKTSHQIALELSNLFNTQNPLNQTYDRDANALRTNYQVGFLPVGQYKIEF